ISVARSPIGVETRLAGWGGRIRTSAWRNQIRCLTTWLRPTSRGVDLLRQRLARPTAIEREQKLEIHRLLTPMRLKRSRRDRWLLKDLAFRVSHQKLPV